MHDEIKNRVHRGAGMLLRVRPPPFQIPRKEDFRAEHRQQPATVEPVIPGERALGQILGLPQRILEDRLVLPVDARGVLPQQGLEFLEPPPARLFRKQPACLLQPILTNPVQGLHRGMLDGR